MMLSDFFQIGPIPSNQMTGYYNLYLVALSYIIAVLTSLVALEIAAYLRRGTTKSLYLPLLGGAFAMGAGIFSMHFIGMLAFIMPMPMGYDLNYTVLSMVVPIFASFFALYIVRNRDASIARIVLGGVIIGLTIATMHYIGMAAMLGVTISYIPWIFLTSILIAIVAAIAALWLMLQCDKGSRLRQNIFKTICALIMGIAICGMHYTGMAAAIFIPDSHTAMDHSFQTLTPERLAFFIACLVALIMLVGLFSIGQQYSIFTKLILGYFIIASMMVPLAYTSLMSFDQSISTDAQNGIFMLTISVIVTVAMLAIGLSLFLSFKISKPIIQLRNISQEIAKGDLKKRAKIDSEDEIGQLAKSFNTMVSALEVSNKKRDEFVGMAAHDLRIPVAVISESSNLLLTTKTVGSLNPNQLRLSTMIARASTSMMNLLDDLLTVDTVNSKIIQINPKPIDMNEFMANIYSFHKLLAEKKEILLEVDYEPDLANAVFDENKITQVINNFVSNAIKFSPLKSTVKLVLKKRDDLLRMEVHDEAGGIPVDEQKKVFTWFCKISVKPTAGEASHGIGLAICKDIIQAHGGKIGFTSTPGEGSVFFFEIKAFPQLAAQKAK